MPLDKPQSVPNTSLATPYITVDSNVAQLGTSVSTSYSGNTAARPTTARLGDKFYNTQLNQLELYTTNGWIADATAPQAPTNITVSYAPVAYGGTPAAIVNFTQATAGNPAAVYTVTSSPGSITATGTSSPITVPGLTTGTSYTFTITASNTYGSAVSSASSSSSAATVPQAPTIGTPAGSGTGTISVPFTAGATGGATPVYTVVASPGNITATGATSPIAVSGLTVNSYYTFVVYATNSAGTSALSATSSPVQAAPSFLTVGGNYIGTGADGVGAY